MIINMKEYKRKIYQLNYIFNKVFRENCKVRLNFDWSKYSKRFDILNKLIKFRNYKKYLEIGCFENENFDKINIETKVGVDPVSGGTIRSTSDDFFKTNKDMFDIIFIDGLHKYEQVRKDIFNSINCLNYNGAILVHDCIPLKLRDQMMPRSHYHWNGDVWKAIVEFRTLKEVDIYTLLADEGIAIIFKRNNRDHLNIKINNFKKLKFIDYYENFYNFMRPIEENKLLDLFD